MERMDTLDAVFLAAEDAVNHMHLGSVAVFEGPTLTYEALRARLASVLHEVPRSRQRVREAPAGIGRPFWIDDVDFDLDAHLRHTALPAGDPFGLQQLVGRVMSHPLDRRLPLWELWLVEGLERDRWALLSKVHHCTVGDDGRGDPLAAVMSTDANAPRAQAGVWQAAPEPSRLDLARYTGETTIESLADLVRGGMRVLANPAGAAIGARDRVAGVARRAGSGRRGRSSLTGPIGPRRRWACTSVPVDDLHTIRRAFGGTVQQVALAGVTQGVRALLLARGEDAESRSIAALMPEPAHAVVVALPIGVDDAVDALHAVRASIDAPTLDGNRAPVAALARGVVDAPVGTEIVVMHLRGRTVAQYVGGRRLVAAYPIAPIAAPVRIAVAISFSCDEVCVGITGDWQGAADVERFRRSIDLAFEDLLKAAAGAAAPEPAGSTGRARPA